MLERLQSWLENGAVVEIKGPCPEQKRKGFEVVVQTPEVRAFGDGESIEEAIAVACQVLRRGVVAPQQTTFRE